MRDFRLRRPGSEDDERGENETPDAIMQEWEMEEARDAYSSATALGPAVLGFASVVVLVALTLAVTLGFGLGLVVLGVGLVLSPIALRWLRTAIVAATRLKRLERESRN